jgi:hypothetical protein
MRTVKQSGGDAHLQPVSMWQAMKAWSRCPGCDLPAESKHHLPGCDFMRKRAIGTGIALGVPLVVGISIVSGISWAILLVVTLPVGLWWIVRRANWGPPATAVR